MRFSVLSIVCWLLTVARVFAQSEGSPRWTFSTGQMVQSSPAVAPNGMIYFGTDNGTCFALEPDGAKKWEFKTKAAIVSSPAVGADGIIYVTSTDESLYALNPDGTLKWQSFIGTALTASPAIANDGTIYVASTGGELTAFGPDGAKKWQFQAADSIVSSPAVAADGTVYFGCRDKQLYAVSPGGERKWTYAATDKIHASPAIGPDGTIYVGALDRKFYALNPDGKLKWVYPTSDAIRSSAAIGPTGTIYFGCDDHYLYALNPDGTKKWIAPTGYWVRSSPAVASDGTIYFGGYDNNLYALDTNGIKKWEFSTGWYVSSSPAIAKDGTVYFGSWDKYFYALKANRPAADSSWPAFRSDQTHSGRVIAPTIAAPLAPRETVVVNQAKPGLAITSPAANLQVFTPEITLQGTAHDHLQIVRVEYQSGNSPFQAALGTTNWFATLHLQPGENTINVRYVDAQGNPSSEVNRTITWLALSRLRLAIRGKGNVSPPATGRDLEVGRTYTLTAEPDKGFVFAGWRGDLTNDNAHLTFVMQRDLSLQALFVPNPFHEIQGEYHGLVSTTNGFQPDYSGSFNLTASESGGCKGKMILGGVTYALNGQFDAQGLSTINLKRPDQSPLLVIVKIDWRNTPDLIAGSVIDGTAEADFFGDRLAFDGKSAKCPQAGRYTVSLSGKAGSPGPSGSGFGAVTVDDKGYVKLQGALPDGAELQQETALSKSGLWPLYLPLYEGRGALIGWVKFAPETYGDVHAQLTWVKPSRPQDSFYPEGFTNQVTLLGSAYTPPAGKTRALNLTNTLIGFNGGNLTGLAVNLAHWEENNKITVQNGALSDLNVKINLSTGLFSGKFNHPATGKSTAFEGALLQKQNSALGFFLGTNQTGTVFLMPGKN